MSTLSRQPVLARLIPRRCPYWVAGTFMATAVVGLAWVLRFVPFLALWGYADAAGPSSPADWTILVFGGLVTCVLAAVLVRQFLLYRWACLTSTVVAWLLATTSSPWLSEPVTFLQMISGGVMPVVALVVAIAMAAACLRGWEYLRPGF